MNEQYEHINGLIPAERRKAIFELIKAQKSVSVAALSKRLFLHEATVRRDLNALRQSGLIKRTYGGAVLVEGTDSEIPLFVRETEHKEQKDAIGMIAARFVSDGDTILLDSSSTTMHMIPFLQHKKGLKIVTNGAKTAILLSKLEDAKIYCTGGMLRENSLSFIGPAALSHIEGIYVDAAFFSCRGVSLEKGLTDANEDEALLREKILKNARKSYLLAVSDKFDKISFARIAGLAQLDGVITEKKPGQKWSDFLGSKLYCGL